MLTELCQELHNWFDLERHTGTFEITGGVLTASFLVSGQYYRVIGSIFNDGVHKYGDETDELEDETFDGAVWALGIPKAVINLSAEIDAWQQKYETADSTAMSPFNSESFGGYSYSKSGAGTASSTTGATGWVSVFASQLNRWRKIR